MLFRVLFLFFGEGVTLSVFGDKISLAMFAHFPQKSLKVSSLAPMALAKTGHMCT